MLSRARLSLEQLAVAVERLAAFLGPVGAGACLVERLIGRTIGELVGGDDVAP
jgi:hypothetical protein